MNSSRTSHITACAPALSSEDAGGEGAKNAFSPLSRSRPNVAWLFGAQYPTGPRQWCPFLRPLRSIPKHPLLA